MCVNSNQTIVIRRLLLLASLGASSSGCMALRNIEQWKCDNWGMCNFGTKPSASTVQMVPDEVMYGP